MPIHLHIGTHKTGTTAIQRQLKRNREALKQIGIWYPNEAELLPGRGDGIPHRTIARSLNNTAGAKPYSRDELQTLAQSIIRISRQYDHTIISSEALWRIGFAAVPDPYPLEELWLRKQSNVAKIRGLFGDADIRITAVLRERGAYIQSGYSEFVLATLYKQSIKAFIHSYHHSWDYRRQLQAWSNHFPVRAYSYEELSQTNQLPLNFLKHLCDTNLAEDTLALDKKSRVNISEPLACVAFKLFLNQLPLEYQKRCKLHRKYSQLFAKAAYQKDVQEMMAINSWLKGDELAELRQSLAAEDEEIRALFCPSFVSIPADGLALLQPGDRPPPPMATADQQQVIRWMLSQKPLKAEWFSSEDPQS